MFGKKNKEEQSTEQLPKVSVSTIPKEFYGGVNPVIKFKNVEINAPATPPSPVKKVELNNTNPVEKTAAAAVGNRKVFIFGAVGLFVLFILGAGGYYWLQSRPPKAKPPQTQKQTPVNIPPVETPVVVPTTTEEVAPTTTPEIVVPTTTISLNGGAIDFPSSLLGNSQDMDHDGLTDSEEELFKTDPQKVDTDGDGYDDSTEVDNLYSPTVFAPERLISTDAVKEFTNPLFGYKTYYPTSWAVANVDPDYRDMLFSTITGENIEIRVFDRKSGEAFEDWFATWAPNERIGSLVDYKTRFGGAARERNDKLVYYFIDDQHIYVIVYHVTNSSVVNYRSVINMMARSFRLPSESNATLKAQEVIIQPAPTAPVESAASGTP